MVSRTKLCQSTVVVLGDFDDFGVGWMLECTRNSSFQKKNEKFFLALASCFSYVHSRRSYIGRCRNRDTGPGPRKTRSIVLYEHTRTP